MKGVSYVIGSILMLIIVIALAGMAYMYIAGVFTGTIQGIEIVDSFCEGGEVTMIIRNIGTTPITSLDIKQTSPTDDILTFPFQGTIDPGNTSSYKDICEGLTGRTCIYRIVPPIGKAATASAFCPTRPTSLVLSLHFDEGFGTTTSDSSGNGNDGTVSDPTNMWISTDCISGSCLSFDGSYDYVEILDPFTSDDFTIELWIKPTVIDDGLYHGFVGKQGSPHRMPSMWVAPSGGGLHYWFDNAIDTATFAGVLSNFFTTANEWYHIVWTKEGTTHKFYRNGVLFVSLTSTFSDIYHSPDGKYWIGRVDNFFNGVIDEVRIYNKALL